MTGREFAESPKMIPGTKFLYACQPGERIAVLSGGGIVVTHPDRPPKLVKSDGTIEELSPGFLGSVTPS